MSGGQIPKERLKIENILDDLSYCESTNNPTVVILDSNNEYSYGLFQFQWRTIKYYAVKYNMLSDDLEPAEYADWALDPVFARDLARKILQDGEWENWYNCLKNKDLRDL